MRTVLFLIIQLVFWSQNTEAKEITSIETNNGHLMRNGVNLIKSTDLLNLDVNLIKFNINDLWNKMQNSISNAWNTIKDLASQTKYKIKVWNKDLKTRAEEARNVFEARLEILKNKLDKIIQTIKDTAGDVKQCIQEDKKGIHKLLKQIAQRVISCIAGSVKKVSESEGQEKKLALDESEFMKEAEKKVTKCLENIDDSENCLNKVKVEIYDDMDQTENGIIETRISTRNLVDDALEIILQCTADGLMDASEAITKEVLKIIKCVVDEKEKAFFMKLVVV